MYFATPKVSVAYLIQLLMEQHQIDWMEEQMERMNFQKQMNEEEQKLLIDKESELTGFVSDSSGCHVK